MERPSQVVLVDIPEQPVQQKPMPKGRPKLRTVNRLQPMMATIYVEELITADHKARAIWQLVEKMDLSRFMEPLRTSQGCAGRPAWDPHLLVSLWVYAYSEGISSAREIQEVMQWEPGLQWLSGLVAVNHHTLSDFRVDHKQALDELFAQLLAMLEKAEVLSLEQVMHDGTKIRALAGADTLRREKTLRERLKQAQEVVAQMGDPQAEASGNKRKQAARERAAREQAERLEAAVKELAALQAEESSEKEKAAVRVSQQEPEARLMKHGDNAIAPSYNAQISTEGKNKIIVGAHLSQCSSDGQSLMPALQEVVGNLGKKPEQVVVDGGFTNRQNIVECAAQQIDLVGSLPDSKERSAAAMKSLGIGEEFAPYQFRILDNGASLECPAGCQLKALRKNRKRGDLYQQYQAKAADCAACRYQLQCCPRKPERGRTVSIRLEEHADVAAFRKKMEEDEYRAIYRKRGAVAEFPNAWIKDKLGVRKFRVRGMVKAGSELLWACLTYNIMQWVRLIWRKPAMA
ncbi:MAG TPA: IS1182 family transposase [Candidatus Polarisedimenticolia bacterium]|nr:IS1182 family transposase [Candidatus Polarisedimenticolia bacterium]